jgi:hypothetical protein
MRVKLVAALAAFTLAAPVNAQALAPDLADATPLAGRWTWTPAADGTEAAFLDSAGRPQLWVHCMRATRVVALARPASGAVPFLSVWTSSATRNVPSSFNPATGRSTAQLSAYDGLLDALAFSRGRVGVGLTGLPALVAPAGPEIARVVEDCRS